MSQLGFDDVHVYESTDSFQLGADSFRSMGWQPSGLVFSAATDQQCSILRNSVNSLNELLGRPLLGSRGLVRIEPFQRALIEKRVKDRRISSQVQEVTEIEARTLLGASYRPGYVHFATSDDVFDLQALTRKLTRIAVARGVQFHADGVAIVASPQSPGYRVYLEAGKELRPRYTVLCTGASLPAQLDQLGIDHPLRVFESPFLRIRGVQMMRCPFLADLSTGRPESELIAVEHPRPGSGPCLIVSALSSTMLAQGEAPGFRQVPQDQAQRLLGMIPAAYRDRGNPFLLGRRAAVSANHQPALHHWTGEWPKAFPGLLASAPAHAGLLFVAAMDVLRKMEPGGVAAPRSHSSFMMARIPQPHYAKEFDTTLVDEKSFWPGKSAKSGETQ
jgi:hypothetical protein